MAGLERSYEARLDAARGAVAAFLNADPEGTIVVPNATTGVVDRAASRSDSAPATSS